MKLRGNGVVLVIPCFNEDRRKKEPFRRLTDVEAEYMRMARDAFLGFLSTRAKGSKFSIDIEDPQCLIAECPLYEER